MPAGRPTSVDDKTLAKLDQAFLMGCTDVEACLYADINPSTLYRYQEKHPEYCERKETLKQNPIMKARKVILGALENDDLNTAHRVVDRKEGSKVKQEISGPNGGSVKVDWVIQPVKPVDV
jgi:hypothetical protein